MATVLLVHVLAHRTEHQTLRLQAMDGMEFLLQGWMLHIQGYAVLRATIITVPVVLVNMLRFQTSCFNGIQFKLFRAIVFPLAAVVAMMALINVDSS